jgi:capsid portal protein
MSTSRKQHLAATTQARGEVLVRQGGQSMAFTFGDPVPVLDGREILDYLECWANGRWYEPPVSLDGLARSTKASVYLQSGLFKRNALARTFKPHRLLSRAAFEQIVMDWGSATVPGEARQHAAPSARPTAVPGEVHAARYRPGDLLPGARMEGRARVQDWSVCHLREADINQEVYGLPEWLASLQSALLNESATLFRRKYYQNGRTRGSSCT